MIRRFLNREVHVYIALLFILVVAAMGAAAVFLAKDIVYNYQLNLPAAPAGGTSFQYGSWPALDNVDFYNQVRGSLIAQKATFIEANLSTMRLQYYKNGNVVDDVAILAKGRPGSWWETPAGLYKVVEKVPSDFSNFAHVYSPWALAFQGNFLIHGWPYYPDGTPVGSTYSGGCIRLSTPDAKTLYDMVSVGTPVLVSSDDFTADDFHETTQGPPIAPTSYLAADLKSNFVLAAKDPDEQLPIASLTKLMTALVAVEYINIENTITITPDMLVKTSIPRLKAGEQLSLYDLLQPLLKESSNEAAVAISDFLGPQYFVSLMNQTAQSIGMSNTHFVDATGSGWGDVSTAHDLFILAQYLYYNRSFILKMTTNNNDPNAYGPGAFTDLQNFNVFTGDPDFVGGKVGVNGAASDTILSVFNGGFASDGATTTATTSRPFMFVILGSDNYRQDAESFLAWIRAAY
ncbi:MAG TPA: L,D-transpeptidase family protein [Candidatus Paceibacterota bacterium]|nr:L,D-transpeptidase family protein [Candidatus Paceibacterota bacterium]